MRSTLPILNSILFIRFKIDSWNFLGSFCIIYFESFKEKCTYKNTSILDMYCFENLNRIALEMYVFKFQSNITDFFVLVSKLMVDLNFSKEIKSVSIKYWCYFV